VPSQSMLYWPAKPVDSHAHLSSVLLALLKRWELKEAPRVYRSSQRRSQSQRISQIPKKRSQRQEGDIDCCSTRFVMHFDSAVRAAFSHVARPHRVPGAETLNACHVCLGF
jgi:hypothetical protein